MAAARFLSAVALSTGGGVRAVPPSPHCVQFPIGRAGRNVQIIIAAGALTLAIDRQALCALRLEVQSGSERKECPVPDFTGVTGQPYTCAIDLRIVVDSILCLIQPGANTFRGARQNRILAEEHGVSAQIGHLGDCARSPLALRIGKTKCKVSPGPASVS